jgi:hypothetical protein
VAPRRSGASCLRKTASPPGPLCRQSSVRWGADIVADVFTVLTLKKVSCCWLSYYRNVHHRSSYGTVCGIYQNQRVFLQALVKYHRNLRCFPVGTAGPHRIPAPCGQMARLFSHHDPHRIHATAGLLVLCHFAYRLYRLAATGTAFPADERPARPSRASRCTRRCTRRRSSRSCRAGATSRRR